MKHDALTPIRETRLNRNIWQVPALILAAALLAACSGNLREVSGEPPQAAIDGLERQPDGIVVGLALRNVNDEPLRLDAAAITVTLDGQALASGELEVPLTISARGREVLRFSLPGEAAGLERLDALASGEVQRLPWTLEARLTLNGNRNRRTRSEGWLHRVPGQPDRFR